MAGVPPVIDLSRYNLETLRKDEELILYRARSKDDGTQVLALSLVAGYTKPESLTRLEHEYFLREELDPTWAARPISIARDWERAVVLLEDPGGVPLDRLLGQPLDVAFSLRLAIGLSSAIDRLHQHGIIHKNIKPANVLVNSFTGQCWLSGFGIASRLPRERQAPEPPEFAIVMKLLAKTAEERYQTAAGVESDLRRCLVEWETAYRVGEFPLGEHDTPDRLLIPEKLYGRASEIDTLLASFKWIPATRLYASSQRSAEPERQSRRLSSNP